MRRVFLVASLALTLGLAAAARLEPRLPYLFASGELTWWVHPEPLSTMSDRGPHRLTFRFVPDGEGDLAIAVLGRSDLDATGRPAGKEIRSIRVEGRELAVRTEHDRLQPALGLGGRLAPSRVQVERDGVSLPAVHARRFFEPRLALTGIALALAVFLLGALTLTLLLSFVVASRSRLEDAASPLPALRDPRPWILAAHTLIAAWNVATYPIDRGLDAAGHVEAARLVLDERRIPAPDRGFQTYHPPLYPILGAIAIAITGSERALQALSALCGLGLLLGCARVLGPERWRGLALVAFLPVLLVTEPQATNEILLALLMTAALAVAAGGARHPGSHATRAAVVAGLLAGLALLTKYTGLFALVAAVGAILAPVTNGVTWRSRLRDAGLCATTALSVGCWPYLHRLLTYGDAFIGNWDDALGSPYRQPPGFRMAAYFARFGYAFLAHPFRAREATLWDALYVSTFGDGFGRMVATPLQHALLLLLAWLALPLALAALRGFLTVALARGWPSPLETAAVGTSLAMLAALVRFNLELPYWSTAKGVFLLGLALPLAVFFERGLSEIEARFGRRARRLLDLDLALFALASAITFLYRT